MNAMLNSTTGGTIYIGVSDDAMVRGVMLNQYKVLSFHCVFKFIVRINVVDSNTSVDKCLLL